MAAATGRLAINDITLVSMDENKPVHICDCPHCGGEIWMPKSEARKLRGRVSAAVRNVVTGGRGGGRPAGAKDKAPRKAKQAQLRKRK